MEPRWQEISASTSSFLIYYIGVIVSISVQIFFGFVIDVVFVQYMTVGIRTCLLVGLTRYVI